MADLEQRNPVSVLYEWCQKRQLKVPKFEEESSGLNKNGHPSFAYIVEVDGVKYGPVAGQSKVNAKAKVAELVCDKIGLHHTGARMKGKAPTIKGKTYVKNTITKLHEFCHAQRWPDPTVCLVREIGDAHCKSYVVCYKVKDKRFPCGEGRNKDSAKLRAAARAFSIIKGIPISELKCNDEASGRTFGDELAEYSWEAFGVLCQEMGEDIKVSERSNLACFLLEDVQTGFLRVVSMGTGSKTIDPSHIVCNGERILDSHSVVLARRGLLVFLYEQLSKLFAKEESIFEYANPKQERACRLKSRYLFHLFMKNAPCGNAVVFIPWDDRSKTIVNDHKPYTERYTKSSSKKNQKVCLKESDNVVSCSDKILLWNAVGLQGALLSIFTAPIFVSTITVTNNYSPNNLSRAFCCRYGDKDIINHPMIQYGTAKGIGIEDDSKSYDTKRSLYWTLADLALDSELEDLPSKGGIIDSKSGTHLSGSDRDGTIPIICKRNIYRLFKKTVDKVNLSLFHPAKLYSDQKKIAKEYKRKKNVFFERLDAMKLGRFSIADRKIDDFRLLPEDVEL